MSGLSKYVKRFTAGAMMLLLFMSCGGPKTIPDRKLRSIFKEVFVANAYVQANGGGSMIERDSLDIYRPILASYGYKMNDLIHTLDNFSKRKSGRVSHVVDQAIKELEEEEAWLRFRASQIDSVEVRSQRFFGRQILKDSSFIARRIADTADLRIVLPVIEGIYEVSYWYSVDSLDKNRGLKTTYVVTDQNGKTSFTNNTFMSSRRRTKVDMKITPKAGDSILTIRFGNYPADLTPPHLDIDSVNIYYKPELKAALDSMDMYNLPYKRRVDEWAR